MKKCFDGVRYCSITRQFTQVKYGVRGEERNMADGRYHGMERKFSNSTLNEMGEDEGDSMEKNTNRKANRYVTMSILFNN